MQSTWDKFSKSPTFKMGLEGRKSNFNSFDQLRKRATTRLKGFGLLKAFNLFNSFKELILLVYEVYEI